MDARRVLGVDPAMGGGFTVIACDLGEKLKVLDLRIEYGLESTEELISGIAQMARKFHPQLVIIEMDGMQKGLGNDQRMRDLSDVLGFTLQPHLTRGVKADEVFGVASMDQSFRKKEIRIPYGDELTKTRMEPLLAQLRAWRPDIPTRHLKQDAVMALWFCWRYWMSIRTVHEQVPSRPKRPSWLSPDPRRAVGVR